MDREIRSTMILHQYIGIFIATVPIILFRIQFPIIEITTKDRSATPRIKIEIEEIRKDLLKDINFNLKFSILRDRKDLQEKIVVISIISKLNNLLCPLKIYFKASLLMEISCSKFKWWCQISITMDSGGIECLIILQTIITISNTIKWVQEGLSLFLIMIHKRRNKKV